MKVVFNFSDYDSYSDYFSYKHSDSYMFDLNACGVLSFISSSAFSSAWSCPAYQTSFRRLMRSMGYTHACKKSVVEFSSFFDSFVSYLLSLRDRSEISFSSMISFSFFVYDFD